MTIVPSSLTADRSAWTTATAFPTTHPSSDSEQWTITVEPDVTPTARNDVSMSARVTGRSTLTTAAASPPGSGTTVA
jgi:hypothetical protein